MKPFLIHFGFGVLPAISLILLAPWACPGAPEALRFDVTNAETGRKSLEAMVNTADATQNAKLFAALGALSQVVPDSDAPAALAGKTADEIAQTAEKMNPVGYGALLRFAQEMPPEQLRELLLARPQTPDFDPKQPKQSIVLAAQLLTETKIFEFATALEILGEVETMKCRNVSGAIEEAIRRSGLLFRVKCAEIESRFRASALLKSWSDATGPLAYQDAYPECTRNAIVRNATRPQLIALAVLFARRDLLELDGLTLDKMLEAAAAIPAFQALQTEMEQGFHEVPDEEIRELLLIRY